jgi:hypothetical protein
MPDAPTTRPAAHWQRRVGGILSVAYVGALALWTMGGREPEGWLSTAAAVSLAVFASRRVDTVGVVGWGLAIVIASLGGTLASASLGAAGAIGTFACAAAACVAIVRAPADGGVTPARRVSPTLPLAILAATCFATLAPSLYPAMPIAAWAVTHPDVWECAAAVMSAGVVFGWTEWTRRSRHLEIGVVERLLAARALQGLVFSFGSLLAVLAPSQARSLARLGLSLSAACVVFACVASDVVRVARAARRATALALAGGGVALLGALAAQGSSGGWVTGVTAGIALAIGSGAAFLERPLMPAEGKWLDAFARARDDAARAEPDDAIRAVLLALRAPNGPGDASPELWLLAPPTQTTVDAAGYLRERTAALPEDLLAVVTAEPEGTLRADVLDALEVRRPDLRPLCAWMTARGALLAALVAWEGEPEGILILPRAGRRERVTVEELRAMRTVADRLAGACRARAASSRMRASVQQAVRLAEAAQGRAEQKAGEQGIAAARSAHMQQRLARMADMGVYSAAARMAVEMLERRVASGAPVVVVGPSGLDPVPFVARAHLGSARASAPLVVVDGTDPREQELARWQHAATSPLSLADGGILALIDVAALMADVQSAIGRACADRRAPWDEGEPLSVQLVATTVGGPDARIKLAPSLAGVLAQGLADRVVLPRLSERSDDLRSLVIEGLAREGMRTAGKPFGIEPSAYTQLADYEFPGDVAELWVLIERLVAGCRGDTVRVADVELLRLGGPARRSGVSGGHVRKDPISA